MKPLLSLVAFGFLLGASQNPYYVSQTGSGGSSGVNCANSYPLSTFNNASNWGGGVSQIGAGTVVHLCGTITGRLVVQGSGSAGNPIEFLWESGAIVTVAHGQIINLNGNKAYLLFDGGTPCGPGTACDAIEAITLTGYASGQTGIIEATASGSALANQDNNTQAFYGCNGCHDIEIKNFIIRNLYLHSLMSDITGSADTGTFAFQCSGSNSGCASGVISIHDSSIHDLGNAISVQKNSGSLTVNVFNVDFYRNNWAMENSGNGSRTVNIFSNHIHDVANWDTNTDVYHHNGLHNYTNVSGDSVATNLYGNVSDGDWGTCCSTATLLYAEVDAPNNFNVFNNVCVQYGANTAPCVEYAGTNGVIANNTFIGNAATASNVNAVVIENPSSGIVFRNNVIEGYGQYVVVQPGVTISSWDHNQYGHVGLSGNAPWSYTGTGASTLAAWRTACSCDASSVQQSDEKLSAAGIPQAGSPLVGAGVNLTSLGIAALNLGRPAAYVWDIGAIPFTGTQGSSGH